MSPDLEEPLELGEKRKYPCFKINLNTRGTLDIGRFDDLAWQDGTRTGGEKGDTESCGMAEFIFIVFGDDVMYLFPSRDGKGKVIRVSDVIADIKRKDPSINFDRQAVGKIGVLNTYGSTQRYISGVLNPCEHFMWNTERSKSVRFVKYTLVDLLGGPRNFNYYESLITPDRLGITR